MSIVNSNFDRLSQDYLFDEVASRVSRFKASHPYADIIRMGIGDVSLPIVPAVVKAMHGAVDDLGSASTFRGYGPERGYAFLREKIAEHDFPGLGIGPDDIFINDGAKSDLGNIGDIFSSGCSVGILDPVYPVYSDTSIIAGRKIVYIPCNRENAFTGDIPSQKLDLIFLCFPNNPTGAVISREKLKAWVDYALSNDSIILFDAAYEIFIRDAGIPHSIYEIEGADKCAIEFRSYSKTAGFTGVRCGYTVVPKVAGRGLNAMWERRQGCKFNGASYISQRAAEAVYSPEGQAQIRQCIDTYLQTAALIRRAMSSAGLDPVGGDNSPYVWARTPGGIPSWDFFDLLLENTGVVVTPGCGFGKGGEGYFRLTAFTDRQRSAEAMDRMTNYLDSLR